MKLKQLLEIEAILGKTIPKDLLDEDIKYYSKSLDEWVPLLDMDIVHIARIVKALGNGLQ